MIETSSSDFDRVERHKGAGSPNHPIRPAQRINSAIRLERPGIKDSLFFTNLIARKQESREVSLAAFLLGEKVFQNRVGAFRSAFSSHLSMSRNHEDNHHLSVRLESTSQQARVPAPAD